jgi:hypothetical protein
MVGDSRVQRRIRHSADPFPGSHYHQLDATDATEIGTGLRFCRGNLVSFLIKWLSCVEANLINSVGAMSILRITLLVEVYGTPDFTYDLTAVAVWSCVEVNSAIVCACLATLKPLWRKCSIKFFSYRQSREELYDGSEEGDRPLTVGKLRVRPLNLTTENTASCIPEWPTEPKAAVIDTHEILGSVGAVNMDTPYPADGNSSPTRHAEDPEEGFSTEEAYEVKNSAS